MIEDIITGILKEREEYQATEEKELKCRRTKKLEEKNNVMRRFGKGEIFSEVYDFTAGELNQEIDEIDAALKNPKSRVSCRYHLEQG